MTFQVLSFVYISILCEYGLHGLLGSWGTRDVENVLKMKT